MIVLVFKTSVKDCNQVRIVSTVLNSQPQVLDWTVDLDDWERILRIEAKVGRAEHEIAASIQALRFECENLDH